MAAKLHNNSLSLPFPPRARPLLTNGDMNLMVDWHGKLLSPHQKQHFPLQHKEELCGGDSH